VQNTLSWINSVLAMGPEAASAMNLPQAARFLGEALGVPSDLIHKELPPITPPNDPTQEMNNVQETPES
jgi:hypothetical protein